MVESTEHAVSAASAELTVRRIACVRCGAAFECGSGGRDGACWCADESYRLPVPGADQDCLCPQCLRRLAFVSGQSA
jgi:hypothetical protein